LKSQLDLSEKKLTEQVNENISQKRELHSNQLKFEQFEQDLAHKSNMISNLESEVKSSRQDLD